MFKLELSIPRAVHVIEGADGRSGRTSRKFGRRFREFIASPYIQSSRFCGSFSQKPRPGQSSGQQAK